MSVDVLPPEESVEDEEFDAVLTDVAQSPRHHSVPRKVSRKRLEQAFLSAFELIGGVPRLALWADKNPGQFYSLSAKLFPQKVDARVTDTSLSAALRQLGPAHNVHRAEEPNS